MNRDFVEILSEPSAADADFLIVGAHALAAHGVPRATGDLDVWVRPIRENAERVLDALRRFGAPLFDLTVDDLTRPDTVFQIGLPPSRVDVLSGISGVEFVDAWARGPALCSGFCGSECAKQASPTGAAVRLSSAILSAFSRPTGWNCRQADVVHQVSQSMPQTENPLTDRHIGGSDRSQAVDSKAERCPSG